MTGLRAKDLVRLNVPVTGRSSPARRAIYAENLALTVPREGCGALRACASQGNVARHIGRELEPRGGCTSATSRNRSLIWSSRMPR